MVLIRHTIMSQNRRHGTKAIWGQAMEGKARFILAATMSSMMVLMVTLIVTLLNLGLPGDFIVHWAKAYIIAWPIAAVTGFLIMPMSRRFTTWAVNRIDGRP